MTSNSDDAGALLDVLRWFARQHPRGSRTPDLYHAKTKAIEDVAELGLPRDVLERAITSALERRFLETSFAGGSRGAWVTTITDRGRDYCEEFDSELATGGSVSKSETMARRRATPPSRPPSLPPQRALPAIEEQLAELQAFKGKRYTEVENVEDEWEHTTQAILEAAFGSDHTNISSFRSAMWAGIHNIGGVDAYQQQQNFEKRLQRQETLLTSVIKQLKLQLPKEHLNADYEGRLLRPAGDADRASASRDAFVIHASADKEDVALPLTRVLQAQGVSVWLDQFEIRIGDNIPQRIDEGLRMSHFGIVIVSQNFFKRNYPKSELDSILHRELEERSNRILPVWHGVTLEQVQRYNVSLAKIHASETSEGLDVIAKEIAAVVADQRRSSREN